VDGTVNDRIEQFPFHAVTIEECYKYLQVGDDGNTSDERDEESPFECRGLTTVQAKERLDQYGYNELSKKTKKTIWQRIWYQIANVLVAILVVVSIVSAAQAIRFATIEPPDHDNVITNSIQVALLVSLIMYVYCKLKKSHLFLFFSSSTLPPPERTFFEKIRFLPDFAY
jgi:magnesium-transporting ATPase (P-type)